MIPLKNATLIIALALLAMPLTGCIENMRDLKDKIEGAEGEPVEPQAVEQETTTPATNATNLTKKPFKAPIARASIYGADGALVFKSSFVAEDVTTAVRVNQGEPLTLNAVDSETQEPGATIATYTWQLGTQGAEGRNVVITPETAGVTMLMLTVIDSNGQKDMQHVSLGVAPAPFDVVTEHTTGPFAGVLGAGQSAAGSFDVASEIDGVAVKAVSASATAKPTADCDLGIRILNAEGEELSDADGDSGGQPETASVAGPAAGTYTFEVYGYACVDADGAPVTVVVSYVPIIEGLEGDGHAHAH